MTSQKQIIANRKNARKSTGPKTPQGKATVARNRSLVVLAEAEVPLAMAAAFREGNLEGVRGNGGAK